MAEAAKLAKFLLGCFRRAQVDDPQVFATAVTRIFSSYPLEVGTFVCDPVTGLPGKIKWLPTVAEVKAECDARGHELAKRRRFENRGKQLAAPDSGSAKAIEAKRPTREELEQKFGKNFGLDGEPSKKKPTDEL